MRQKAFTDVRMRIKSIEGQQPFMDNFFDKQGKTNAKSIRTERKTKKAPARSAKTNILLLFSAILFVNFNYLSASQLLWSLRYCHKAGARVLKQKT